ncbi:U3 small nucleolar RNA-associated protein 13 [Gurleya vavrai]
MQKHFKLQNSFQVISKNSNLIKENDLIITFADNLLITTNTETNEIISKQKFESEITYFTKNGNDTYVGLFDGTLFINDFLFKPHKSSITFIEANNDFLITGSADKTIKLFCKNKNLIVTVFLKNVVTYALKNQNFIYASDIEGNIYQFNLLTKKTYFFQGHTQAVTKIFLVEDILFSFGLDGKIYKFYLEKAFDENKKLEMFVFNKNEEKMIGYMYFEDLTLEFPIQASLYINDHFYFIGDLNFIYIMNKDLKIIEKICIKINDLDSSLTFKKIFFDTHFTLISDEDEILFLDENLQIKKIIAGNNDEITDMIIFNNFLFLATNSGRLRCIKNEEKEGNFCCAINLFEGHNEAIMSIKSYKNKLITSSRDKTAFLWDFDFQDDKIILKSKILISGHIDSVNSCDINENFIVTVSKDLTMQIFDYNLKLEQRMAIAIHEKEINYVKINNDLKIIATASQDKTIKIFDFEGKELYKLSGHKRGVWMLDFGKNIMASCSSDETIRIWNIYDFSCIKVLEGQNCSVLNCKIFNNDKQIISSGNDGIIRIWDVKKGKIINSIDLHKEKVWSIFIDKFLYSASTDGVLNVFKDVTEIVVSEEKELEKNEIESKFMIDKNIKEEKFLQAFKIAYKQKNINDNLFRLLSIILAKNEEINELFDVILEDVEKLYKIIEKHGKMHKNADTVQKLITEGFNREIKFNKNIMNIVKKHLQASDDLCKEIFAYELLFKSFISALNK